MKLQEAFDPQISPIYADGSELHLAGEPWAPITPLFYLRNLRHLWIELGVLA